MPFTTPVFNVLCDVWFGPRTPADGVPDAENQECQLYFTPKGNYEYNNLNSPNFPPPIYLRLPAAAVANWESCYIVECPPESNFFYVATWKERVHLGFPNQYLVALVSQCDETGAIINRFVFNPDDPPPGATGVGQPVVLLVGDGSVTVIGDFEADGIGEVDVALAGDGDVTQS